MEVPARESASFPAAPRPPSIPRIRRSGSATASRRSPETRAGTTQQLGDDTRFELDVDGFPVEMRTDLQMEGAAPLRKTDLAEFPAGLPVGWHELVGRWYDSGKLILSSRASIQFVER